MARNMRTESNDETEVAIIASSVHPAGSRRGRKTFFGPEIIFFSAYLVSGGKSLSGEIGKVARDRISAAVVLNFGDGLGLVRRRVFGQ